MKVLDAKYTLFIEIPVFTDGTDIYTSPLWAKDLLLHLDYLPNLYLCSPTEPLSKAPEGVVKVEGFSTDRLVPLRRTYGYFSILKTVLPNFLSTAKALRQTQVAHSGGGGWPFPLSFYILAVAPFIKVSWVVLIESSFWMKPEGRRATLREQVRHMVYKFLLKAALKRADARVFTTDSYRQFFGISKERCLIAPAVWVDAEQIISEQEQDARLAALPQDEIKFLFPARLVPEKGSDIVLEAVSKLETFLPPDAPAVSIDIIGEGPLLAECQAFAQAHTGKVTVRVLDQVSYPDAFFKLLRSYHAILLANRHHEQPRVVYDAFAQGVCVLSSATDGVAEVVSDERNALLYKINDSADLAQAILRFSTDPKLQLDLVKNARSAALGSTHKAMHDTRSEFFDVVLEPRIKK